MFCNHSFITLHPLHFRFTTLLKHVICCVEGDLCQLTVCEALEETEERCVNSGRCIITEQGQAQCLCTLDHTGPTCAEGKTHILL